MSILSALNHRVVIARPGSEWAGLSEECPTIQGWTGPEDDRRQETWIVLRKWEALPKAARVDYPETVTEEMLDGIPVAPRPAGLITNLPEPAPGIFYIVSATTHIEALTQGRVDTLCPDTTSDPLLDDDGRVLAVRRLLR